MTYQQYGTNSLQSSPTNIKTRNVNNVLGQKNRAFLTARKTHVPTAEALDLEISFLEYFLKHAPRLKAKGN